MYINSRQPSYHISSVVSGQAKVSYLHMVLGVQENVDGLQVPVDHALVERRGGKERRRERRKGAETERSRDG